MTKPDLLSAGSTKSRELWLDVLEGRRYPLTHGYYCTRQPDDADRIQGITSANSRIAEVEYFAKTLPWSTTKEQDRLGTHNLVSALSKLLVGLIDDRRVFRHLYCSFVLRSLYKSPKIVVRDNQSAGSL
jgi:hypothetical protein